MFHLISFQDKFANVSFKASRDGQNIQSVLENNAFEEIGDDDLWLFTTAEHQPRFQSPIILIFLDNCKGQQASFQSNLLVPGHRIASENI